MSAHWRRPVRATCGEGWALLARVADTVTKVAERAPKATEKEFASKGVEMARETARAAVPKAAVCRVELS